MKLQENGQRILWVKRETWCCHEGCELQMRTRMRADGVPGLNQTHDEFVEYYDSILRGAFNCEGCVKVIKHATEYVHANEMDHFI